MILQSLVNYYETLQDQGKVAGPGWCRARVSFALDISQEGELLNIIDLRESHTRGKKTVLLPKYLTVPEMVSRSSGISANFMCDNSKYILGIDEKGTSKRLTDCFLCARKKHEEILQRAESKTARAVMAFFLSWDPKKAEEHQKVAPLLEELTAGANLVFWADGRFAMEDEAVRQQWELRECAEEKSVQGVCMVTGEKTEIARTHTALKGVQGAQPAGAALVSFNAPAFCSYGKEQNYNAPVGKYAAYAYTTALNYLLADKEHCTVMGDTTIVYWAANGEEAYQMCFEETLDPKPDTQELLAGIFKNLESKKVIDVDEVMEQLSLAEPFYILGLVPNAARISVRFFHQDSFGNILKHFKEHYERMEIVQPAGDSMKYMGIYWMLQETVNKKSKEKKPHPGLAAAVLRGILSGTPYPRTLYSEVIGRIRAEQDDKDRHIYKITKGRAAIIKAFLIRNDRTGRMKEEILVELNENNNSVAYILGREFAVLEMIQKEANPEINATIKDRYFNSACATPATVMPILFKLKNSHTRKFSGSTKWKEEKYEKILRNLQGKISVTVNQTSAYPKRLSLEEQGMFVLGYYQQVQKLYEKKTKEDD